MALSPADFYAYSRATGAPVPEDPEERARIAPEVLAYRRNQLKAPQQEEQQGPDPLSLGLGIGLGLAGLGGAAVGIRRFMRGPKQSANAGVQQANLADLRAKDQSVRKVTSQPSPDIPVAQETQPQPSRPAPSVQTTTTKEVDVTPQQEVTTPGSSQPMIRRHGRMVPREQGIQRPGFTPRSFIEERGSIAPAEDLTSVQQQTNTLLTDQTYEAVESGIGQETQRIDAKLQRHTGTDVPDVDIPQGEDTFEAFGLLPPVQRTLTKQEKEAKIFARLETEALKLGKTTHSATDPFGLEGPRIPPGPLLYPSQIPVEKEQTVAGVSSPTREFLSAFAQGDPRVQNVVREENVKGFKEIKESGGVKGATLLEGDVFDPLSGELISQGEQISGKGKTRQVLNPAWTEAYKTYWERRATELPHTLDDYEARKAVGKLNYQLPPEQQTASNNAQMFEKWDKGTSEALQDIYAETVGDIPQYIVETVEPKTTFSGTQTQYRGDVGTAGEATGAPVPVLNPKGIVYGAQIKNQPAVSVGETSLARAAQDPSYASGKVLRFKGEGGSTKIDVMPLSYDVEEDVLLPSSVSGQTVKGKVKVTRTALVPLQKAVFVKDPQTGQQKTQLVNFSVDLLAPVGTRTEIDEFGRKSAKTITLQEAVNDLRSYHGKNYPELNRDINDLLKRTHSAYDVPVMTRQPFEKYDEARNEFIRMLGGTQYEGKEYGFLTSVEGQKLPYTGPIQPGSKGNRTENVANARLMLSQAGVPLEKISDYLPDVEELGTTPRIQTTSTRDVGIPAPDIMSTGTELGIRTSTYERISPRMGGAVTSQLRNLISQGAKVENINGNVVYSTAKGQVSYPERQLIETLKSENQDAPTIANLVGRSIATQKSNILSEEPAVTVLPQERASETGYYYDDEGRRLKEPITTPQGSFTGLARLAAGPASEVLTGNYPRGERRVSIKTSPENLEQLQQRNQFALAANLTPGGRVRQGAIQLGGGLGVIPAGIESLPSESTTIERYGVTGGQLKQVGETLMSRAAQRRAAAQTPVQPQTISQEAYLQNQATAQHLANYITAAAKRLEGPETWKGDVKLRGKGQSALRPYQAPSEAMIQQLIRNYG